MKTTELRIGNLTEQGEVKSFHEHGIHVGSGKCYVFSELKPIPLTEEWLLKFGFNKWKGWLCYDAFSPGHPSQRFDLYWSKKDGFMTKSRYQGDNDDFKMRHIEYVHQLQNLYFALTGEELKQ